MTVHLCVNSSAGNSVDLNTTWSKFLCKCFCKWVDCPLCCWICNLTACTIQSPHRRYINNFATVSLHHVFNSKMATVKHRIYVSVTYPVPLIFAHILEKSDNRYSGIVDKHINLTETLKAHVKHFLYITVISHIAYKCFTDTAFFLNNGFDFI